MFGWLVHFNAMCSMLSVMCGSQIPNSTYFKILSSILLSFLLLSVHIQPSSWSWVEGKASQLPTTSRPFLFYRPPLVFRMTLVVTTRRWWIKSNLRKRKQDSGGGDAWTSQSHTMGLRHQFQLWTHQWSFVADSVKEICTLHRQIYNPGGVYKWGDSFIHVPDRFWRIPSAD